jgi:hypothetical protein
MEMDSKQIRWRRRNPDRARESRRRYWSSAKGRETRRRYREKCSQRNAVSNDPYGRMRKIALEVERLFPVDFEMQADGFPCAEFPRDRANASERCEAYRLFMDTAKSRWDRKELLRVRSLRAFRIALAGVG